jgi:energy-coupling factor transporter ATP-binding protein EcfA2
MSDHGHAHGGAHDEHHASPVHDDKRITYFAATHTRGKHEMFGIRSIDRGKHVYVIGKTGMGKSTMLENMAIQDIQNGEGLAFIDPHGSTAEKLLDFVPHDRIDDVVYFAPFDTDFPVGFNVMEDVGYDKRHLVVSGLMAAFKKIWVDAWSARMEYILTNTLLALLEYPDATLLGVNRMYTDKSYRKKVVENVKDPVVKDFWVKEFATYTDRYTQEATPAIQNKIGQFTSNPLIRNIIGQPKSSFDLRTLMDDRKIIIINLSKGLVGDTNTQLLGSMLTTRIFLAAMSRANASARELALLPNFYFYVDEFQNFANETFAEILSEARKYKLNLIIAHQYIEQMEEEVRDAVFGNVGTTVTFRVGPFDAETLETIFTPEFVQEDLVNLGFAQIYLSLMIDGIGSRPFSAVTIPPIEPPPRTFRKEVLEASRTSFAAKRPDIEEAILKELSLVTEEAPQKTSEQGNGQGQKKKNKNRPPEKKAPPQNPPSASTTAADLKAAIQAISKKVEETQTKTEVGRHEALKETLAHVAPKAAQSDVPPSPQGKKPAFEVPQENLEAVFKGDA